MTGRKLGNYDILDKLGEGGMGQVWRAKDARLNRSVAIKILPADVAGDEVRRERFEQEARSLGALNHPNIVAVYDVGQTDGQAYIVSELVEGESLRAVIERGPISGRRLLDLLTQTAEGIAAAHAIGIVHRDLKPENIMVARDGRVKVLDFGLAKQNASIAQDSATIALSQPGMVLGTVGYMSPEQVRGEPVDARSDIFSFGCVGYEMEAGKQPFTGKSAADVMSSVLREDPPEIPLPLPAALTAIIYRCLEKDPARRFQSAADLAFALRSMAQISQTSTSQPAIARLEPKRRAWLVPALGVVGAALLFAAGYWVRARTSVAPQRDYQRLTFREGHVDTARFTPDGENVVYEAEWDGDPSRLYVSTPGAPESRPLDTPPNSRLLAVSSKGDLALLRGPFTPDGLGTLARASLHGGPPRALLENVRFADWSPDGSELAVVRKVDGKLRLEYPIGKVLFQASPILTNIRVSPDGQRVALCSFGGGGSALAVGTVDRAGKVEEYGVVSGQIQLSDLNSEFLSWSPDGREIWFRSFDAPTHNTIFAIDRKGNKRIVTRFPGRANLYDVAPDGRILLSNESRRVGIRGAAPGAAAERDLSCLESSDLRAITPDGSMVLANSIGESGGPKGSIYWRMTDGAQAVRLSDGTAFAISPDGKWVTGFSSRETTKRKYVVMPTGAGEEFSPSTSLPQLPGEFCIVLGWLPGDGNYIVGGYKNSKTRLYAWNRPANTVRPISQLDMADQIPGVSPDARQLIMPSAGGQWMVCAVDTGSCGPIPDLSPHDEPLGWRADNRSLYMITHHDENPTFLVSIVDAATGKRSEWKTIRPSIPVDSVSNLKITPDGRAYAYNYTYTRSDLYLGR
jgi:Tol biopolymer transport system component